MKSSLLKGLTKEEVSDLKGTFKTSVLLRKQLRLLLSDENKRLQDDMLDEDILLSSNWSLVQASKLAQIKANNKLILLLE